MIAELFESWLWLKLSLSLMPTFIFLYTQPMLLQRAEHAAARVSGMFEDVP